MKYKIVELAQGSPEWLQFKQDKIGSSEIGSVIGANQYLSAQKLLAIKRGEIEVKTSAFMLEKFQTGHDVEAEVRARFFQDTQPIVIQSVENPRFIASIDCARIQDGKISKIVEVKSTSSDAILEEVKAGNPVRYFAQVQWQMMIAGIDTATLVVVYTPTNESFQIEIASDQTLQAVMKLSAEKFLNEIDKPKTELTQPLREKLDQLAMLKSASVTMSKQLDVVDEQIKALADEILKETNSEKLFADQVKIETVERQGSVDYAKIEVLKTVNLDQYRKKPSRYLKVTLIDGKKEMTNEE